MNGKTTQKFKQRYTTSNFTAVTTDVKAGVYNQVYKKTVPAQQVLTYGTGSILAGVDNRGIVYCKFQTSAPAVIDGWVRFKLADANEFRPEVVFEERTEILYATKTDRTSAYFLAEFEKKAGEDSLLIIELKPDADATVSGSDTELSIPITIYA